MKVFDCFTFFSTTELDLLEFRLKLLSPVVDYFVISEANRVHSGAEKSYILQENWDRFKLWHDKIIYLPVELSIDGLQFANCERYSPEDGAWRLENDQRNALAYANEFIDDQDLCLIGDLDELPDPYELEQLKFKRLITDAVVFNQLFHYYYMNCQNEGFERFWNGTVATKGAYFKAAGPQYFRDHRNDLFSRIENGGWHFSYLGGIKAIRNKIQSFAHTEFNRPEIISDENIIKAIENGIDIFHRPGVSYKFHPLSEYPEYLQDLMRQYPQFIKEV